ncbi:MAG: hypothetical protein RIG61_11630 [Deltaproteobacteria bacterium]
MLRIIQDVEFFETKVSRLFGEATEGDSDLFDIYELGRKIGLDDFEIESMSWHLQRGGLIEREKDSGLIKFSEYGRMMESGQIKAAYAPI